MTFKFGTTFQLITQVFQSKSGGVFPENTNLTYCFAVNNFYTICLKVTSSKWSIKTIYSDYLNWNWWFL